MKMGTERAGAKNGGGFFHLFDWNKKKSRKKLFATISPEGSKQSRKTFDILPPSTHLRQIVDDGDDVGIVSSVKASSDYSCASSVTDEDGNGNRGGPSVVARLMGLDSMPTTAALEPYSSPIFEPQNLRDRQYQQNPNPGHEINSHHSFMGGRPVVNSKKKLSELKIQRMPSSPIEKFHTEMLPPRSAKSLPIGHHKLMSPIRNPRFISSKDAADIMEAASKILEPGIICNTNSNSNVRVPSLGPLRFRDSKDSSLAAPTASSQQRTSMILESSKRPVESNAMKYLRGKNQNKSWNGLDCDTSCRASSSDMEETKPLTAKCKRKSVSLAIQAKVNVQKREGLSRPSNRTQVTQEELEEFKSTQPFKNQRNSQKDRLHKKTSSSASSSSSLLKQNSRSQRFLIGKEKSPATPSSTSTCQGRKAFSGETSSSSAAASGTKSVNKPHGNPKSVYRRKGLPRVNLEKEVASSTSRVSNNLNRKKRSIEVDYDSDRSGRSDNLLAGRYEKRIQHNVIADEQLKQQGEEDGADKQKNGMDVVSFTFTSPIVKQLSGSQPSIKKWDDYYYPNDANDKKSPSHGGLSKAGGGGDALSILLEQKLRELTLGLGKDTNYTTVSFSQDLSYVSENSSGVTMDNDSSTCESGLSSINGQLAMNSTPHKLQEFENQNPNPLPIPESPFSYESCITSESYSSIGGLKSSSVLPSKKTPLLEAELEVSDSASSFFRETSHQNRGSTPRISRKFHSKFYRWEVEYIKEMLSAAKLNSKNFAAEYNSETLTPLLFEQLETKNPRFINIDDGDEGGGRRLKRKAMFDCVKECLDLETQCYFNTADYKTWRKGMMMVVVGDFADVIYKKIAGWSSMGDCMVDELVDKDMSSHFGRWVNFERDVFETGVEIEDEILSSLIDEVIAGQLNV